ncbi:MAG: SURF1 family protein, partial [Dehalococcoidia bacterium]
MRLPVPVLLGLLVAALAVLVSLGVWQLQRNEWKHDLVARSHQRTDAPPLDLATALTSGADDVDFRRVVVTGEWLTDDVMFIANRVRASVRGEEIVIPVRVRDDLTVLVNFGWIPDGSRDDVLPEVLAEAGAPVAGLALNLGDRTARRAPSGSWTAAAPTSMGAELGYEMAPWIVLAGDERTEAARAGDDLPVQGWQRFTSTTPHLEYALTWFGLALALVAIAGARFVIGPWRARPMDAP